ncbi:unnamed protein product, partial [Adineta steineri]
MVPVGPE